MNKNGKDHIIETYRPRKSKHNSTDTLMKKGPKMLWFLFFL